MKVALVYDRLNKWGGAERVLLALHKLFPQAPLYTSVYDEKNARWAQVFDVRTSFLQKAEALRGYNDKLPFLMPLAFESFNFDDFELVISVTSEAAKGILTKPGTSHICYCLTPTRYLWSSYDEYFRNGLFRLISKPAVSYLKNWDKIAAQRPDRYIAISAEVSSRINKYYGRESKVIYPPVTLEKNKTEVERSERYYLLVSRFSRGSYYKKVELAIKAFNRSGEKLLVVGSGPMLGDLKKLGNSNIEFLGEVSDQRLGKLYAGALSLIFPGKEDFGLVIAEAQSFGTPVIAYKEGGATEIIEEGVSGELFEHQTQDSLLEALKRFEGKSYNKADIKRNSERFSFENFKTEFLNFVNDTL